jgi:hypothetical protein
MPNHQRTNRSLAKVVDRRRLQLNHYAARSVGLIAARFTSASGPISFACPTAA